MKFKERKKLILYDDWNFIGSIANINREKEDFYKKTLAFFNKNLNINDKDISEKINRFISLIKWTDVFVDDYGNIRDKRYYNLLDNLLNNEKINEKQKYRIRSFLKDLKLLLKLKKNFQISQLRKFLQFVFKNNSYKSVLDYQTKGKYMSDYIASLNGKRSIKQLNRISFNSSFIKHEEFTTIVEL